MEDFYREKAGARKSLVKGKERSFPGCSVVKNLPANEGDMGSIPGPYALEPVLHNKRSHHNEKPAHPN